MIKSASLYDYGVIAFYMVLMLGVSYAFRRLLKNSDDYFKGGSRTVWWIVGSSSFMTSFSAWTFTGAASMVYGSGIGVTVIFLANTFGFFINAIFLCHWYRQMRATTLPEVLQKRYSVLTQQIYAWTGVVFSYLMAGLHLWGVSIFCSAIFGLPLTGTIVVVGMVVVAASTMGGSWSAMASDFVQAMILLPMTALITIAALFKVGGFSGLLEKIDAAGLQDHLNFVETGPGAKFTIAYITALILKQILVYNGLNDAPKYFAVKDGKEARKAAVLAGILMFFGSFLWFIPPLVARLEFSQIVDSVKLSNPAEASYAVISMQLLPTGLLGLMVVAMLSATMSSMDSSLNRNSAVITRDIVKGWLYREVTEKQMFLIGHIFTFVSGACIIGLALYFAGVEGKGIFDRMVQIGALVAVPKLVPMLWGIFIRKVPSWSALFSLGCGMCMSVLGLLNGWNFATTLFVNFGVGSTAFFLTMFFWSSSSPAYKGKVDEFFRIMKTPVDFEKEIGGEVDRVQLRNLGLVSAVLAVFVLSLVFIPGNIREWGIYFVAGFLAALGALLCRAGFRSQKNSKDPRTLPVKAKETVTLGILFLGFLGPAYAWESELFPKLDGQYRAVKRVKDSLEFHLPDFSYAGYKAGEEPIPDVKATLELKPIKGETGKKVDNAPAINAALRKLAGRKPDAQGMRGKLLLSPGTFTIQTEIKMYSSGVVLSGSGTDKTFLYVDSPAFARRSAIKIVGPGSGEWLNYPEGGNRIHFSQDAEDGSRRVILKSSRGLKTGDRIVVRQFPSLAFSRDHGANGDNLWPAHNDYTAPRFLRVIQAVRGDTVELNEPIRYPLYVKYGAHVFKTAFIENVGVENLSIGFKAGDGTGSNSSTHRATAISFRDAINGWIRNVNSYKRDSGSVHLQSYGFTFRACKWLTVENCTLKNPQNKGVGGNGYLFNPVASDDLLFRNCEADGGRHNFTLIYCSSGNVFTGCRSRNSRSDFHQYLAPENLFDNFTIENDSVTAGNRGDKSQGSWWCAAKAVFWNLQGTGAVYLNSYHRGYLVGVAPGIRVGTGTENILQDYGLVYRPELQWVEKAGEGKLEPASLYQAQLANRLAARGEILTGPAKVDPDLKPSRVK